MQYIKKWKPPTDYGGFSPAEDYVVIGQNRDSSALERSNYECVFADLKAKAVELHCEGIGKHGAIYDYRAGHWAVGWVETVLISGDAPVELLEYAEQIIGELAECYPVFSDAHFGQLEWDETCETWENMSIEDRLEIIQDHADECSIFAARHDYPPNDSSVYQHLRKDQS